jgi:integrase
VLLPCLSPTRVELAKLKAEALTFIKEAWTPGTHSTFRSQEKAYLTFCHLFDLVPVPATTTILLTYVAWMARRYKATTVGQYLGAIRRLHAAQDLPPPPTDSIWVYRALRGIRRNKAECPKQAMPITTTILVKIHATLDLSIPDDMRFWALCLVAYYSFLRKSNLAEKKRGQLGRKTIRWSDIRWTSSNAFVRVRETKTLQFGQRMLTIPLPKLGGNVLCPWGALKKWESMATSQDDQPAFAGQDDPTHPPMYSWIETRLKAAIRAAGITGYYTCHSFRRGGASAALQAGVPAEFVRLQGDWTSDAYLRYIKLSTDKKIECANALGRLTFSSLPPSHPLPPFHTD